MEEERNGPMAKKAKNEDTKSLLVQEEIEWADLPTELLHEIFSRVFAGDRAVFLSVCKSWSSISHLTREQRLGPLTKPDGSHPYLMSSNKTIFHPVYSDFYDFNCPDMPEDVIHATREDWLLMRDMGVLYFFNPFTTAKVTFPFFNHVPHSPYFSSSPTSKDWKVVAVITTEFNETEICSIRSGDENWTLENVLKDETFTCSSCNTVVCQGTYYFLGTNANLLSYDPKTRSHNIHEAPKSISELISLEGKKYTFKREQYMLESDGNLLCVFVGNSGSPVHVYQWNVSTMAWKTIDNLGNKMLFVSRPLSLIISASVAGTGNKIYFPRFIGKHGLFYSLSTNKYHTFEMGTTLQNHVGSILPLYATWISPQQL